MTDLIKSEAYEIFIMFYAGLTIMLIMELKNMICNRYRIEGRLNVFVELFTWLIAAYLFGSFSFYCAYGRISAYGIVATLAGVLLWKKCLYGILDTGKEYAKEKRENSRVRESKSRCRFGRGSHGEKRTTRAE